MTGVGRVMIALVPAQIDIPTEPCGGEPGNTEINILRLYGHFHVQGRGKPRLPMFICFFVQLFLHSYNREYIVPLPF
jgi:hypothetical protein